MRTTATPSHSGSIGGLPRGWPIIGLAMISWALFAAMWLGAAQLYSLVAAAL